MRQRTVSLCRRNSETCSIIGDISRSHISLNQLHLSRRQMSLTHSEPDSDKEGAAGMCIAFSFLNTLVPFVFLLPPPFEDNTIHTDWLVLRIIRD